MRSSLLLKDNCQGFAMKINLSAKWCGTSSAVWEFKSNEMKFFASSFCQIFQHCWYCLFLIIFTSLWKLTCCLIKKKASHPGRFSIYSTTLGTWDPYISHSYIGAEADMCICITPKQCLFFFRSYRLSIFKCLFVFVSW